MVDKGQISSKHGTSEQIGKSLSADVIKEAGADRQAPHVSGSRESVHRGPGPQGGAAEHGHGSGRPGRATARGGAASCGDGRCMRESGGEARQGNPGGPGERGGGSRPAALLGMKAEQRPGGVPRARTGRRRPEGPGEDGGEVRRGREGSQRHESLVGGENGRRMLTGARGTVFRRDPGREKRRPRCSSALRSERRLESAASVEGGGARGDGASEAGRGNGADAGVWHDVAKPLVAVVRNDGGGSGCGDRLEGRRRAAAGGATVAGWFSCTGGLGREGKMEREVRGMFL
uniref:Uncharacterized protein n=1 Tax=Oryza sativa subsp. japonica TaxID=39947 RepID=Q6EQL3_ORYSJ|nr:hypothetical protein [Oryza sativa Japonica Group]